MPIACSGPHIVHAPALSKQGNRDAEQHVTNEHAIGGQHLPSCNGCRVGRKPSWLDKEVPQPWSTIKGTTLITGHLLGPNPTHQLNLHWYHIFRWMKQVSAADLSVSIHKAPPVQLRRLFQLLQRQHASCSYGHVQQAADPYCSASQCTSFLMLHLHAAVHGNKSIMTL